MRRFFDEKIVDVDSFIAKAIEFWNDTKAFQTKKILAYFFPLHEWTKFDA